MITAFMTEDNVSAISLFILAAETDPGRNPLLFMTTVFNYTCQSN
jgi:hypothetical protein